MKHPILLLFLFCSLAFCIAQPQKVEIYSANTLLNAYFYHGTGTAKKPTLIWCHGNPGSKEDGKSPFANELNKLGINVIMFNYRGLWGTDGVYKMNNSIEDLSNVLDFTYDGENIKKYKIDTTKLIVGGYSYGTNVIMISALNDNRIKNIFCLGISDHNYYYFTPESLDPNNKDQRRVMHPYINDVLYGPNRNFDEIQNEFNLDIMRYTYEYDYVSQAEKLQNKNMLFVVGLIDTTTPIEYHFLPLHRKLMKMGHDHYKYKILESDHYFKNLKPRDRALMISQWINE